MTVVSVRDHNEYLGRKLTLSQGKQDTSSIEVSVCKEIKKKKKKKLLPRTNPLHMMEVEVPSIQAMQ